MLTSRSTDLTISLDRVQGAEFFGKKVQFVIVNVYFIGTGEPGGKMLEHEFHTNSRGGVRFRGHADRLV